MYFQKFATFYWSSGNSAIISQIYLSTDQFSSHHTEFFFSNPSQLMLNLHFEKIAWLNHLPACQTRGFSDHISRDPLHFLSIAIILRSFTSDCENFPHFQSKSRAKKFACLGGKFEKAGKSARKWRKVVEKCEASFRRNEFDKITSKLDRISTKKSKFLKVNHLE